MKMLEVFVAYTKGSSIAELEATLNGWDLEGLEPVAIECGLKKFEITRRVTAENLSLGDYILAELGCTPVEEDFAARAEKFLAENPAVGLVELPSGADVFVCRKKVVDKWPTPRTESYLKEHREAYQLKGFEATLCPQIHYRRLVGSLPF